MYSILRVVYQGNVAFTRERVIVEDRLNKLTIFPLLLPPKIIPTRIRHKKEDLPSRKRPPQQIYYPTIIEI